MSIEKKYIEPNFEIFASIEVLNQPKSWSDKFDFGFSKNNVKSNNHIKIDDILSKDCVCICGDPGCGKSRLFSELSIRTGFPLQTFTEKLVNDNKIDEHDLILLDALDEVSEISIVNALQKISSLRTQGKKIYFSCRQHNIEQFRNYFNSIADLCYIQIQPFDQSLINEYIDENLENETKKKELFSLIRNNETVKKICTTPRYLENLVSYISVLGTCSLTDGSVLEKIFDYVIYQDFKTELEKGNGEYCKDLKYIVYSVLEKVALVMAIRRTDNLTKSELYATLDNTLIPQHYYKYNFLST